MTKLSQVNSKTKIDDLSQKDLSLTHAELFLNMVKENHHNQDHLWTFSHKVCNEMYDKISKFQLKKILKEEDKELDVIKSQIDKYIDDSVNLHSLSAFVVIFALLLYVVVPYESHMLLCKLWLLYAVLRSIDVTRVIDFERRLEIYARSYSGVNNKNNSLNKSRILIELTCPKTLGSKWLDVVIVAISIVDRFAT